MWRQEDNNSADSCEKYPKQRQTERGGEREGDRKGEKTSEEQRKKEKFKCRKKTVIRNSFPIPS